MENSLLAIFDKIPCTIVHPIFEQLLKIVKNPILIGISSNLISNMRKCICIRKNYKNGEFPVAIFDEIGSKTLYYSTGSLARFFSNFKIHEKSNCDQNQLKISKQHKKMYMHQEKL